MLARAGRHYLYQASHALLRVAGDLDVLGSPVAVLGNLGTGIYDFFSEPASALLRSPRELHRGIAKGTHSLVRNTLIATAHATSKVSGTLGKGLAALSLDDDYMRRRAARLAAPRPQTIGAGLRDGARTLGISMAAGASGLFSSPIEGARRDGVKGALVGVAQGAVGVVIKPAAGVLDVATMSAEWMRTSMAAEPGAAGAVNVAQGHARARPPRALGPDAALQVYDHAEASRRQVLLRVEAGKYRDEALRAHIGVGAHSVLLTHERVLYVRAGTWEQAWQAPWPRVKGVELRAGTARVELLLFRPRPFSTGAKRIECHHAEAAREVYRLVQDVRSEYSQRLSEQALSTHRASRALSSAVRAV